MEESIITDLASDHPAFLERAQAKGTFPGAVIFLIFPGASKKFGPGKCHGRQEEKEEYRKNCYRHTLQPDADRHPVAQGDDCREQLLGGVDQPVVGEDPRRVAVRFVVEDLAAPEHIVTDQESAFSEAGHGLPESPGILVLVDVVENDIELTLDLVDELQGIAHEERNFVGDLAAMEIGLGVLRIIRVPVGADHPPVLAQGLGKLVGRIAESGAELKNPLGARNLCKLIQDPADQRADDREVSGQGVVLHVCERVIPIGRDVEEVLNDMSVDDVHFF